MQRRALAGPTTTKQVPGLTCNPQNLQLTPCMHRCSEYTPSLAELGLELKLTGYTHPPSAVQCSAHLVQSAGYNPSIPQPSNPLQANEQMAAKGPMTSHSP
jgi:hypothetical protein